MIYSENLYTVISLISSWLHRSALSSPILLKDVNAVKQESLWAILQID